MKILVCGSRMFAIDSDYADGKSVVWSYLDGLAPDGLHLVMGGARGPDDWAQEWATQARINHTVLYADWEKHGRRAGVIRNLVMLDMNPDLVLAFWDGESKGTKHTIDKARERGIPVEIITA